MTTKKNENKKEIDEKAMEAMDTIEQAKEVEKKVNRLASITLESIKIASKSNSSSVISRIKALKLEYPAPFSSTKTLKKYEEKLNGFLNSANKEEIQTFIEIWKGIYQLWLNNGCKSNFASSIELNLLSKL